MGQGLDLRGPCGPKLIPKFQTKVPKFQNSKTKVPKLKPILANLFANLFATFMKWLFIESAIAFGLTDIMGFEWLPVCTWVG